MAFTNSSNNTFPPTVLQPPYKIWKDWCIGDSLGYLNDNIAYLETLVNTLSTYTISLSSIIQQSPYAAKAWVYFDGTKNTLGNNISDGENCLIKSSYNVSSVVRRNNGALYNTTAGGPTFKIIFASPMSSANYTIVGTANKTSGSGPYTATIMEWTDAGYGASPELGLTTTHCILGYHYGGVNTIGAVSIMQAVIFG